VSRAVATHLHGELVLIESDHGYRVSDHPVAVGGSGKGPSPGELMLAALTASAALRGCAASGAPITVMASFRSGYETIAGPMAFLGYVSSVRLRIQGTGTSSETARREIEACPVASALSRRVAIGDTTRQLQATVPRQYLPGAVVNTALMAQEESARRRPAGERVLAPDSGWRVRAEASGGPLCTVHAAGQALLVGRDDAAGAPAPLDLLVAAVAVSTAIHVARHAAFRGLALERVRVEVEGDAERLQRRTDIAGSLGADEFAVLKFCAEHSALGESLVLGVELGREWDEGGPVA
jgi:uncharacterized OsmC-like protein